MFWTEAEKVIQKSLVDGSLMPISTESSEIEQGGVRYKLYAINQNLIQKVVHSKSSKNPFLPYEPAMYVGPAGDFHVCLLNKFPVLSPHLLICTRHFAEQSELLTLLDFEAWSLGFDGSLTLGFYNGGTVAGASQQHKHMQLVKTEIPLEEKILSGELPFKHWLIRLDSFDSMKLFNQYQRGMKQLELLDGSQCKPYNLLLTSDWLLILPRSQKCLNGVFVNGLNYAGLFLVKKDGQADWLKSYGPMRLLCDCGQVLG